MRHLVITPVFNEEKFLVRFINSVINQERVPDKFLLVDDDSTDSSATIIKKYCTNYSWIEYVLHPSGVKKKEQGVKVVRAFNYGLNNVSIREFDIISKIDADLELPPNYFLKVEEAFKNKNVGITGGIIEEENENGDWIRIPQASYHIRGALKSYRTNCFSDIDGLMPVLGWDGLDEMKALYHEWETLILDICVKHFRPAASDYNQISLAYNIGYSKYKNGSNLILAIIRSAKRLTQKPYLIYSLSYLCGFLVALMKREEKYVSKDLQKFINKFHFRRIYKQDI